MKPNPGMKSKLLSYGCAAILLGSASFLALAADNRETIAQTPGGISYVSGGVGDESIDRLNMMVSEFNLKLVFAMQSGNYVSDVRVVIMDAKGKTILDTTTEGPWLLTRLPAGSYQIVASFAGKAEKRQVDVGATKLSTIDFRWGSE
jgi:hypothetical protein